MSNTNPTKPAFDFNRYSREAGRALRATSATRIARQLRNEAAAAKPITARGTKGWKNAPWEKTFKSSEALTAWCEKNDATVEAYLAE